MTAPVIVPTLDCPHCETFGIGGDLTNPDLLTYLADHVAAVHSCADCRTIGDPLDGQRRCRWCAELRDLRALRQAPDPADLLATVRLLQSQTKIARALRQPPNPGRRTRSV